MERKPLFDLTRLAAAAKERRIILGQSGCLDFVLPLLGNDWFECRDFACAVVRTLTPKDLSANSQEGRSHDEYGIRLPSSLLSQFGLVQETWRITVTMTEESDSDQVICLELYPLQTPMECVGGYLVPWEEEQL